ncbi:putative Ig domain-containing protein [Cryptosporangium sp. NPDC048952]|uniref:putative Ig domain-containing protein n=1 Tax=Cryptosporangium sp. NPDC048952 TaxID=3363961 RepID=UPI003720FF85
MMRNPRGALDPEAGFSLIELMTAMTLIGIVMASLTGFFTNTVRATNVQSNIQTAVQLVSDALERVRSMQGSAITTGRDQASVQGQWSAVTSDSPVSPYLTSMQQVWDDKAAYPAGSSAPLPTAPSTVVLNNVTFTRSWFVGQCWQPLLGGDCSPVKLTLGIPFYRVVTLVTWSGTGCPTGGCSQIAATLVSTASADPLFNANETAQPPRVVNPGRQNGELTVPVSLLVTATGGAAPLTWMAAGLPPGLAMDSTGTITGTPTLPGTYAVVVTATDGFGLIGSAAFSWIVAALPTIAPQAPISSVAGTALTFTPVLVGGTSPFSWTAANLPAGLSIDAVTGVVSGTPTTVGTSAVTVSLTDAFTKTDAESFTWTVTPALSLLTPTTQATLVGKQATPLQIQASGGVAPYTYKATDVPTGLQTWQTPGLPPGLTLNTATGVITGKPTLSCECLVKVTVTDAAGKSVSAQFIWAAGPYIKWPRSDQSGGLNTTFDVVGEATGGLAPYLWSVDNLPDGVTLTQSTGRFNGKLAVSGRFYTTVRVTDKANNTDSAPLVVTVTTSTGFRITAASTERSTARNTSVTITPATAGGTGTKTWSAANLPLGTSINTGTGVITGAPTTAGQYIVAITAKDGAGTLSRWMFVWTVT